MSSFSDLHTNATGPVARTALATGVNVLRRTWYVFIGLIVAGALAGYLLSDARPKEYRASATLNFQQTSFDSEVLGNSYVAPNSDPTQVLATQQALVSLPGVARQASQMLGGSPSAATIGHAIQVNNINGSTVETVTATDKSPAAAARIANAYAQAYVTVGKRQDRTALTQAAASLTAQIRQARIAGASKGNVLQLQTLLDRVNTVSALQTGGAQVVDAASIPTSAASPRPKLDAVLGGLFGLLLAIVLVAIGRQVDRKVRDLDTLEHLASSLSIGDGVLGAVERDDSVRGQYRLAHALGPVAESFGLLQARLRYLDVDGPRQLMMLVSASAAEGKSTLAFYLAATAARSGNRVLLIECDLRRPQLAERLGGRVPDYGLAEYLSRFDRPLSDVVTTLSGEESGFGRADWSMDVLPAGGQPPNPAELLESGRMVSLLEEARTRWDLVLLDTPPIGLVPDGIPLLSRVDGVLVVARMGAVTRESLRRLNRDLMRTGAKVLGVVANMVRQGRGDGYDRGYGYGYESGPRLRRRPGKTDAEPGIISNGRVPEASAGVESGDGREV